MALNEIEIRPEEWFNARFKDLINNRISYPPYNNRFKDKYFFFEKRDWITSLVSDEDYIYYDIEQYTDSSKIEYFVTSIRKSDNYIELFEYDDTTGVMTSKFAQPKWKTNQIYKTLWWWKDRLDTGTATSATATTLVDSWWWWTVNAWAGNYLYISSWPGAWQLRVIASNTSTAITVSWWTVQPTSASTYIIYEELVDVLIVPYATWAYVYDWDTWTDRPVFSGEKITEFVSWNSRLWFDSWPDVYYSDEWDFFFFNSTNVLQIGMIGLNNLTPVNDFLLVSNTNKVWIIYKGLDASWWEYFVYRDAITSTGILSYWSLLYDNWLYIVTTNKRFLSVDISILNNAVNVKTEDQWYTMTSFLLEWSSWKIFGDLTDIYLYEVSWATSNEIIYNWEYKWRLRNIYSVNIQKKKYLAGKLYILGDWFVWENWWLDDVWNTFNQTIEVIAWVDDIFNTKNAKYLLLLMGKSDYKQTWEVEFWWQYANRKSSIIKKLENAAYINEIYSALSETMWSTLFGYSMMWWENTLNTVLSDVELLKIPVDRTGNLFNIIVRSTNGNGISFWWSLIYYNQLRSVVKPIKNIL